MMKKLLQLVDKLKGRRSIDLDPEVKEIAKQLENAAALTIPSGAEDRIRQMLKVKHAEMVAKSAAQEGHKEKKHSYSPDFGFMNFFNKNKFAYGMVALIALVVVSFGSYPFIPAPKVQGYAVKNAVREIPYNAPFKLIFSQPMNRASVEKSFTIDPPVEGEFKWRFNTVMYWPKEELKVGDRYTVNISKDAKSLIGKNIEEEYQEVFEIIEAPKVSFYTPAGSDQVGKDAKITVMFNQPLLKLTTLTEAEKHIPGIEIEPRLNGKWKWLGTSALQFIPEDLKLATTYNVTIPSGIVTASEGKTDEEVNFSFTTETPRLTSVYPDSVTSQGQRSGSTYTAAVSITSGNSGGTYGPDQEIRFAFNQKVDLGSFKKLFELSLRETGVSFNEEKELFEEKPNNKSLAYNARYLDLKEYRELNGGFGAVNDGPETEEEKADRERMIIVKAKKDFPFDSVISYTLKSGLRSTEGPLAMETETVGQIATAAPPVVSSFSSYRDYATIYFNNDVEGKELKKYARLKSGGKEVEIEIDFGNEETGYDHFIDFKAVPGAEYELFIAKEMKDAYGQPLADDYQTTFRIPDLDPWFEFRTASGTNVMDHNLEPEIFIKTANINDEIEISVESLDPVASIRNGDGSSSIGQWKQSVGGKKNEYKFTKLNLNNALEGRLSPGYYRVNALFKKGDVLDSSSRIIALSTASLAVKQSRGELLVWATDIETGQPISDMEIGVYRWHSEESYSGKTDSNGIATIKVDENLDRWSDLRIIGRKGAQFGVVENDWNEGINAWNFNIDSSFFPQKQYTYLYTDRPIYRPGDEVNFKGIVRTDNGRRLELPSLNEMSVVVRDPQNNVVYNDTLRLSKNGTFDDSFKLDGGVATGTYRLIAFIGSEDNYEDRFQISFSVAEYRKPDFKVSVNTEKKDYSNSEEIEATIKGEYFFGGQLAKAPVEVTLTTEDYYFNEYSEEWYNFSKDDYICFWECPEGSSEMLVRQKLRLDEKGEAVFNYTPSIKPDKPSQIYTIEATVTDPGSQQEISNRVILPIHKGEYYVGVRSADYLYDLNDDVEAQIITVDPNGKPIGGKKVSVQLKQREWTSIRKQNIDGYYYYENDFKDTLVRERSSTTGEDGKASLSFGKMKEGGSYVLETSSKDSHGNVISSSSTLYVMSGDYISWGRDNNDRMELVPDKLDYKVGETARVLVKSPYANVKALVTIERDSVMERRLVDIKSNSHTIEIPIKEDYLPNAYVSVLLVKGGGSTKSVGLKIDRAIEEKDRLEKRADELVDQIDGNIQYYSDNPQQLEEINNPLQEELREIKKNIESQEEQIGELKAAREVLKNSSQNEDGIASFKLGYAELKVDTASKKLDVILKTDKEKYLPGEEVTIDVETLDANGRPVPAEVSLSVVDQSVLSLKENVVNDLIGFFYKRRYLGVETAHSLTLFLNRINVEVESGLKGGGGGLGKTKRTNFKDTAFWQAKVHTGSQAQGDPKNGSVGTSQIKFKLPDNLTTWQILAIGATKDTKIGSKKTDILVTKDLLLRPVTPRFLTINDELEIGLVSHSSMDETIDAKATLTVEGVELLSEPTQNVRLFKDQDATATWKIKVLPGQKAKFIFKVEDEGASGARDEVEISLPVNPYTFPEVVATSGVIQKSSSSAVETVFIPKGVDSTIGQLDVSIAATFLGSIADGLEYLVRYPYGCAEQTASSLLPNLAVKQVLNLPQIDNNLINVKDLDEKVAGGLQRLYNYQQSSGGFGIWHDSRPTVNLTAYILYTLHSAKEAGYNVDSNVMSRAERYITDNFFTGTDANSMAYALFALSEVGKPQSSMMNNLYDRREELNLTGKAFLGLAMSKSSSHLGKAQNITNFILSHQKVTPRGIHFEEESPNYYNFDSNAKLNAAVLRLLTRVLPESPVIDKMLFEIRHERIQSRWQDTHASSQTLISLVEYLTKSGEFDSEFFAKVIVNGGEAMDNAFFKKENFGAIKKISIEMAELLTDNQENEVLISRNGSGKVYYDVLFKYFLPLEQLQPREEGFSITHDYYLSTDENESAPLNELPFGETIKGKITIVVPEERHYVMVEDRLPAGLEALDFSLKTTKQALESNLPKPWENNLWYFNHEEFRDDRVVFFADYLPSGVYELRYFGRVTSKGSFSDLPAHVEQMYQPEVFGRTIGRRIEAR